LSKPAWILERRVTVPAKIEGKGRNLLYVNFLRTYTLPIFSASCSGCLGCCEGREGREGRGRRRGIRKNEMSQKPFGFL
jgi:hypothetical protein